MSGEGWITCAPLGRSTVLGKGCEERDPFCQSPSSALTLLCFWSNLCHYYHYCRKYWAECRGYSKEQDTALLTKFKKNEVRGLEN